MENMLLCVKAESDLRPAAFGSTAICLLRSCEGVSYFWNYRIANCATITQELETMIAKQIETTEKAVPSTD